MEQGLNININEFRTLPLKQKVDLLFQNQEVKQKVTMDRFDKLEELIEGYKFNQKVTYIWLLILTIGLGFTKFLGLM